jgi:hypothetical protein
MLDERTPPAVLITTAEKGVVRGAVRTFVKALVPHLPAIAKFGGPAAVTFMLTTAHTWADKAETDKKVAEASQQADATTRRAYKGLAKPAREISGELAAALKRIDALEATQKAQSALIVARERDFVVEGRPAMKSQRRRVDAGLIKTVKENAAKDSKELAARKRRPAPAITPIPLELPPPPSTSKSAPQLPPVLDAGRSP